VFFSCGRTALNIFDTVSDFPEQPAFQCPRPEHAAFTYLTSIQCSDVGRYRQWGWGRAEEEKEEEEEKEAQQ
jgi:hypothetical protein